MVLSAHDTKAEKTVRAAYALSGSWSRPGPERKQAGLWHFPQMVETWTLSPAAQHRENTFPRHREKYLRVILTIHLHSYEDGLGVDLCLLLPGTCW